MNGPRIPNSLRRRFSWIPGALGSTDAYLAEETPKNKGAHQEMNVIKAWQNESWAKLSIVSIKSTDLESAFSTAFKRVMGCPPRQNTCRLDVLAAQFAGAFHDSLKHLGFSGRHHT